MERSIYLDIRVVSNRQRVEKPKQSSTKIQSKEQIAKGTVISVE